MAAPVADPLMLQVNDDWILRRLERWGKKEGMPFLGQKKGAILQQLVQQRQPKLAVEVGTMAGYSAILIAQVCHTDHISASIDHTMCKDKCASDRWECFFC